MKKTVLFYSPGLYTGGVATAFRAMAAELEAKGVGVRVIVPYAEDVANAAIPREYVVGSAWRRPCRWRLLKRLLNAFNIWTGWFFYFLFQRRHEHDVFVQYLPTPDYQWARYVKKPAACFLHALAPKPHGGFTGRMWKREIKRDLDRFQTLVAVSPAVAESWKREYDLSKTPLVIGNLIDVERIRRLADASVELPVTGRRRLVYVGRLSCEKGILRLLEAVARIASGKVRPFELVVVGDGDSRKECEEFVEARGLTDVVRFVGARANPYAYMRAAEALVVPSYEEGFGLSAVEAILCGTPVIATDCGGTRSALADGRYGLLVENSDEGIERGVRQWLERPDSVLPVCGMSTAQKEIAENDKENRRCIARLFSLKRQ